MWYLIKILIMYGISYVTIYKWNWWQGDYSKRIRRHSKREPSLETGAWNPKKGYGHIRSKVSDSELNEFISDHKDD